MGFANPLTVSVPVLERDLWFWPAVQGERYPPVFTTANYNGGILPVPAYSMASGSVQFPKVPRVLKNGAAARLTLDHLVTGTGATSPNTIIRSNPSTSGAYVETRLASTGVAGTVDVQLTAFPATGTAYTLTTRYPVPPVIPNAGAYADYGPVVLAFARDGSAKATWTGLGAVLTMPADRLTYAALNGTLPALEPYVLNSGGSVWFGPVQVDYP